MSHRLQIRPARNYATRLTAWNRVLYAAVALAGLSVNVVTHPTATAEPSATVE